MGDVGDVDEPIISSTDDRTKRWMAIAVAVVVAAGVVAGAIALAGTVGSDDDDSSATAGAPSTATTGERIGTTSTTDTTQEPPSTTEPAPAPVPVNLLLGDATPAVRDLSAAVGQPFLARELVLYTDYAFLEFQDPAAPTHIDRLQWRNGDVGEPEPVRLPSGYGPDIEAELFDLAEVQFDLVPAMAQDAFGRFALENPEVTHVIVDRFLPFDDRVLVRVYVSDQTRGGGGYVRYTGDGTFVAVVG